MNCPVCGEAVFDAEGVMYCLEEVLETARHLARFLKHWDGLSGVRGRTVCSDVDTPEFELYCLAVIADEMIREKEWLKGEDC